jgi:transaldolase
MTKLERLHADYDQSPWLDNLTRGSLRDGSLARLVAAGIRGVTTNPTTFGKTIEASTDYDEQITELTVAERAVDEVYWELVIADVTAALAALRPVFDSSAGTDGFVSLEVAPKLAHDTQGTIAAARELHQRIDEPNLFVKIPATAQGVPAIEALAAQGRSINVTLIFSLTRYAEVIEAYLTGLEAFTARGGDPASVHSVASFFVSRVDTEVDQRLEAIGTAQAHALHGQTAIAQAKLAYRLFTDQFSGPRWQHLAGLGAHPQRPLWASTSTKNPSYADTRYVDELIGPSTISTLPEPTIAAFEDHGHLARTLDSHVDEAVTVMSRLAAIGIDIEAIGLVLEDRAIARFSQSFERALTRLRGNSVQLGRR